MIDHLVRHDFKAVDKREEVGTLAGFLRGETDEVPIVCDRGRPYGVVNEKRLLRSRLNPHQHLDRFVVATPVLSPGAEVEEALAVVAETWVPHVPVGEDGRLLGYVRATDLLREVADARGLDAHRMMLETPFLAPGEPVGEVIHRFYNVASDVLPVVERSGRLVGVVARKDIAPLATDARPGGRKAAGGERESPRGAPIEGYVDDRFETVRPNARFDDVVEVLDDFGAAIVIGGDRVPRGVVTPESAAKAWVYAASQLPTPLPYPGSRSEGMPD